MTSSARTVDQPPAVDIATHDTRGLSAGHSIVEAAFSLLDHRTRARTIARQDAPPGRYLAVEDGDTLRLLSLDRPLTHVGRGLIADIRLEDPHVSRRHAIVALRGERVRVLDDRSGSGTFVNGREVTVAHLTDGDVVRFGRAVFRYTEIAPVHPEPVRRGLRARPHRPARRRRRPSPARASAPLRDGPGPGAAHAPALADALVRGASPRLPRS